MDANKKLSPQDVSAGPKQASRKKPWRPMKLKLAGDAKDVIRHGVAKTSPGSGDPGETLKNVQQG